MISAGFSFLVACAVSAAATPLVRRIAVRRGLVEGGDGPLKVHAGSVPRTGGVAIVLAFFVPLAALFVLEAGVTTLIQPDQKRFLAFCAGGLAIFALGLWDDFRGAGAALKFSVEIAIAKGIWLAGFRIEVINVPGFGLLDLGPFGLLVTLVWIVGITNALNLVDGIDGLAAGVALFAAIAHVCLGVLHDTPLLTLFAAALAGAVLGFLPYNFHPAKIFLGDSGALFLGYCLATSAIYGAEHKSTTAVAVLGPLLILGLPILDTGLAIVRRVARGKPVFDGDREHVHHLLLGLGMSQRRSALLLYALCAAFALAGLVATAASDGATALVLVSLLVVLGIFEHRLGFLRRAHRSPPDFAPGPAALLALLRRDLETARDVPAAWTALTERAAALDFYRMRHVDAAGQVVREWARPGLAGRPRDGVTRLTVEMGAEWARASRIEIEKRPFRGGAGHADELFAALFAQHLGRWAPTAPRRAAAIAQPARPARPASWPS